MADPAVANRDDINDVIAALIGRKGALNNRRQDDVLLHEAGVSLDRSLFHATTVRSSTRQSAIRCNPSRARDQTSSLSSRRSILSQAFDIASKLAPRLGCSEEPAYDPSHHHHSAPAIHHTSKRRGLCQFALLHVSVNFEHGNIEALETVAGEVSRQPAT
jgi:hypothetical protein